LVELDDLVDTAGKAEAKTAPAMSENTLIPSILKNEQFRDQEFRY